MECFSQLKPIEHLVFENIDFVTDSEEKMCQTCNKKPAANRKNTEYITPVLRLSVCLRSARFQNHRVRKNCDSIDNHLHIDMKKAFTLNCCILSTVT